MRAFFAIGLDGPMRAALVRAREAFCDAAPAWRSEKWVSEENLHLTLAFLGDVPESVLAALAEDAATRVAGVAPFTLTAKDLRAVPRPRAATMLWCTVGEGEREAAGLAAALQEAAALHGIDLPGRPFAAHLTLVRSRRPRHAPADALASAAEALAAAGPPAGMSVTDVTLCSSTLTPRGPIYSTIARLPLHRD
ncbi:MAG: RNA 2',3'-cyclic phosphodiesterase [Anaerosomatales bacterium]|nr:RNA 2',3'-cyclic phosphodiesterase [Anaerosomatales bacterium]